MSKKSFFFAFILIFFLSVVVFEYFNAQPDKSHAQTSTQFSFGVAGDFGANTNTAGVLTSVNSQALNFFIALGDLSYNQVTPESSWCNYVKSRVGMEFPFQLVAGNHEDDGPDGQIGNFAVCLPNRMLNIIGTYPKEYYFDYPPVNPIARFILISPNLTFPGEGTYSYNKNTTRYNWTATAIDTARAAGIKWVVVGMHKYCISLVTGSCQVGANIMNLLVEKKVDLYFQAHDHAYARSKQLALNSTNCTAIAPGSYNANCTVDDGADNLYTKGRGTVLMTVGSGGGSMNQEFPTDPEGGYFAKWMGTNFTPTFGFMKFNISDSQITANFVKAQGSTGMFVESFSITGLGPSPIPGATPTASPTVRPSPSPTRGPSPSPTVRPACFPDANSDGQVTLADFFIWVGNYGKLLIGSPAGDFCQDGKVNALDFSEFSKHPF